METFEKTSLTWRLGGSKLHNWKWKSCSYLEASNSSNCENSPERYCCRKCQFETDLIILLKKHIKSHFGRLENGKNPFRTCFVRRYDCRCSFQTHSSLRWFKHKRDDCRKIKFSRSKTALESRTNLHSCSDCPYRTPHRAHLRQHVINRHTPLNEIRWFKCDQCAYKAKAQCDLKTHKKHKHSDVQWFQCAQCPYTCKYSSNLRHHEITKHTPEHGRWHRCPSCEYRSVRKCDLEKHVANRHTSDEQAVWAQCDSCAYRTKYESYLKIHKIRKHAHNDEIQWLECEQCAHRCKTRSDLRAHNISVHSQSKTLECEHCGFTSKWKSNMNVHKTRKHRDFEAIFL